MSYTQMYKDLLNKLGTGFDMFQKLYTLSSAVVAGDRGVSDERMQARLKICMVCPLANHTYEIPKCGICGCKLHGNSSITNLVAYEETGSYGCKFPGGSKWKKEGV